MKRFAVILLVLLAAASERSNAATPAQADPLRVQSARQEQIQGSSGRVAAQLDQILMEFELNGISGEDVNVLSAIRSVVHRISAEDMVKVIESLTKAREAGDSGGQQAADAFSSQRTIITQLRQVLAEYQRQQALHDIAMRLRELAARQTENMRLAVALARQVDRRNLDQYPETQRLNLQLQEAEESSLRAETGLVLDALGRLGESAGDATSAERIQKAVEMAKSSGLLSALDSAVQDLKNVRLLGAAGNEKKARDQMREIARQLTRSLDRRDALREALRELDVAMDKHQTLMERTRALQQKDEAIKREVDQADLVDATDLIRKDVDDLAPEASEHLEAAMERMQEARSAFLSQDSPARIKELAVAQQSEAQTKMEQARRELVDQLTKAESLQQPPENKMAAVEAMQMRIRELIAQQQALRKKTSETAKDKLAGLAPRQGDIKDQTQESQQQASSLSSEASEALGDAASQMQKSQKSLAESQNSDASQEAALEALSRAEEALAKEKEMLAQAAEELNQLEEILKKLVAIIEDQQGVFSATTRSALNPAPEVMPLVVNQQVMLADRTRSLEGEVRKPVPKASGFLSSAEEQMKASKVELAKPAPAVAQPKQSDALKELYSARREIEKKINALQEQLGEESEDSGSLEDVADAIREAQKETNEALSQLQKGAPNAMQTLLEKQNQIATDLEQPVLAAPSTVISRREAGAAASKLRQSDLKSAVAAMKEALKSMNEGVQADHPKASEGTPNLPAIESHQKEVLALANQLMSAMENLSKASMQKASDALGRAGKKIRPMSSGKRGGLPQAAQKELESAQENLDSGEAEAGAQQGGPAQSSAQKASQHLAQAQAAIALAQSGLGSDNQQQASNSQGQGKKPGQGQTRRSKESQPGPSGDGREGNWRGQGGADGPTQNVTGSSRFTGLPARDRAAIQQSQSEAYPQEYAPLIEQYLRNLSDQSEPK